MDLRSLVESAHDSTGRRQATRPVLGARQQAARKVFSLASPLGSPADYGRPSCKGAG